MKGGTRPLSALSPPPWRGRQFADRQSWSSWELRASTTSPQPSTTDFACRHQLPAAGQATSSLLSHLGKRSGSGPTTFPERQWLFSNSCWHDAQAVDRLTASSARGSTQSCERCEQDLTS